MLKSIILIAFISVCSGFSFSQRAVVRATGATIRMQQGCGNIEPQRVDQIRRSFLSNAVVVPLSVLLTTTIPVSAGDKGKVVVLGGAGWVGSHVSANLSAKGYKVISISRSSPDLQVERTKSILGKVISDVEYKSLDAGTASVDELASVMKDSLAVVSCVGISPGSQNQKDGNGLVNTRIAKAAKAARVPKIIYIGVASSLANGPAKFLLGD